MITLEAIIELGGRENISVTPKNLISLDCSIFDRSDLKLPSFGIISNTGNIKINDMYDSDKKCRPILQYAEKGRLSKGLSCEVYLNNTILRKRTKVATLETDRWDYDSENFVVSVSIKDDLEELQNIEVEGIGYNSSNSGSFTLADIYNYLYNITSRSYRIVSFGNLDEKTQLILSQSRFRYPILESGTLWQQWTKLCQVAQLHMYKNNEGLIMCKYNGGN